MPRPGKRYICLDWNFFEDAEDLGLTEKAERLFIRALMESAKRGSDGVLSRRTLRRLGGYGYHKRIAVLEKCGWILEKDDDTFYIPSWSKWNESQDSVSARRAADRNRKRLKQGIPRDRFRMPD